MDAQGNMKLKLARIEKNLTQQDLADQVAVTRQTIGLIEKGNYNPTLNLLYQDCQSAEPHPRSVVLEE